MTTARHPSSYRDPSGFLFFHQDFLYRQVNQVYKEDYLLLLNSGLYEELVSKTLLIAHEEVEENLTGDAEWFKTLRPELLPFISYPSEWSFDMLKDAALVTLEIAEKAMASGMMLKDASAYNLQYHKGKMIFIDSLSFEKYDASLPWIAYRQFCENFLAPLAMMHYLKIPLHDLWKAYPEGIPLQLAGSTLPFRTKWNLHVYLHIHLHNRMSGQKEKAGSSVKPFSSQKLKHLFRSLKEAVTSFKLERPSGVWSDYYTEASTRDDYMERKKEIISTWLKDLEIKTAIDTGANEGFFSKLLLDKNAFTIAADLDHYSVNNLYHDCRNNNLGLLHPMIIDLSAPTPAIGVNNEERTSFLSRVKTDMVLALALVHHLSIGHNIPFETTASMFSRMGKQLIIEFVPKEDEKVRLMLLQKKDIYPGYSMEAFEKAFSNFFSIVHKAEIPGSGRTLYLMKTHIR
jgi:hypothetical protein